MVSKQRILMLRQFMTKILHHEVVYYTSDAVFQKIRLAIIITRLITPRQALLI